MTIPTADETTLFTPGTCPTDGRRCDRDDLRKCGRCDTPKRCKPSHPLTAVLSPSRSTWIHAVTYLPRNDTPGRGFLLIFTKDDHGKETALAYSDVPSWLKGLLLAGYKGSIGRAYHRLVRGKYPSQTFTSPSNVGELKKMFGV